MEKGMLSDPFCCVCGKVGSYPGGICPDCQSVDETVFPFEKRKEGKSLRKCKRCERVLFKKRWGPENEKTLQTKKRATVVCTDCYKESMGYYQAILKLPKETSKERTDLVSRAILSTLSGEEKRSKRTAVTKVNIEKKEFYFTHLSTVRAVVRKLKSLAQIQVRKDAHLFGYDASAGKGKFKVSVLVRFLDEEK